jgi:hypothetical protein
MGEISSDYNKKNIDGLNQIYRFQIQNEDLIATNKGQICLYFL